MAGIQLHEEVSYKGEKYQVVGIHANDRPVARILLDLRYLEPHGGRDRLLNVPASEVFSSPEPPGREFKVESRFTFYRHEMQRLADYAKGASSVHFDIDSEGYVTVNVAGKDEMVL